MAQDASLTSTYYANQLAGTLVQGAPSLTCKRALAVWLAEATDLEIAGVLNTDLGNVLPNWRAEVGAMNQKANTTPPTLSFHDALRSLTT